jgi:hypothetical protein
MGDEGCDVCPSTNKQRAVFILARFTQLVQQLTNGMFFADAWTFAAKEINTRPLLASFECSCGQRVPSLRDGNRSMGGAACRKTRSNTPRNDDDCPAELRYWRSFPNDVYYAFSPSILKAHATLQGRFAPS